MIHHGDCLEVMPTLPAESFDAIVTDPPYDLVSVSRRGSSRVAGTGPYGRHREGTKGAGFMGKEWDGTGIAFRVETWAEAFRVAKPGAHLLAFGGTRTYHRLACAIEDAGWEIRDCLVWAYASGFPKSHNLPGGWGTALKPAWEPIVLARKPLRGTVAANVQRYGTGALNIDGCRIGTAADLMESNRTGHSTRTSPVHVFGPERMHAEPSGLGRWPANLILTDPIFDGDTPGVVGGGETTTHPGFGAYAKGEWQGPGGGNTRSEASSGTYSRFFLLPKAARSDREPVLGGLISDALRVESAHSTVCAKCGRQRVNVPGAACSCPDPEWVRKAQTPRANHHPTVKPTELMRHLVRLVTPPGGTVLDPFLGSGSTALACEQEGFGWVGIEKEADYVAIAEARLNGTQRGIGL